MFETSLLQYYIQIEDFVSLCVASCVTHSFVYTLARETPTRKPDRDEGIVSTKPRPKNVYDFIGLVYGFIVL